MESQQELLKAAWHGGRRGYLSAMSQAKAWALREVWRESHDSEHGMNTFIAGKLKKQGRGKVSPQAVGQLFSRIDGDVEWFPGKSTQEVFGPASVITPQNQATVARSAMAMKDRGEEPTYSDIVAANPVALLNPATGKPVGKKRVYSIVEERCYDDPNDPEDTWVNARRLSKKALTPDMISKRLEWALDFQEHDRTEEWLYQNVVWTDLCNSILPRSEKRKLEQTLARKGSRGWQSPKSKLKSKNLRGNTDKLKQNSWDAIRVWWAPILTRGKLHIEILGEGFPGEKPEGAAILAERVRHALNIRFQGSTPPRTLFTDRGQGFYNIRGGRITDKFKASLRANSLKMYYGDDASVQPGNLQEVLLHETAVSWIRYREARQRAVRSWEETVGDFGTRMKRIVQDINDTLDVEGLCRAHPKRVQAVIDAEGDRIKP